MVAQFDGTPVGYPTIQTLPFLWLSVAHGKRVVTVVRSWAEQATFVHELSQVIRGPRKQVGQYLGILGYSRRRERRGAHARRAVAGVDESPQRRNAAAACAIREAVADERPREDSGVVVKVSVK